MIEFAEIGKEKKIDISEFVKAFDQNLKFKEDLRGKRWIKYKRGVITIDPTERVSPGEYEIHLKMSGNGREKTKVMRL